jgi:hypothetical protein
MRKISYGWLFATTFVLMLVFLAPYTPAPAYSDAPTTPATALSPTVTFTGTVTAGERMASPTTVATARGRNDHAAVLLPDGTIFLGGHGFAYAPPIYDTADIFDPATNAVYPRDLPGVDLGPPAILLLDGRLWLGKGNVIYDYRTGEFSPAAPPLGTFVDDSTTLLQDGRLLKVGGYVYVSQLQTYIYRRRAELYDPETDSWTLTGSLNEVRSGHTATLLPDGTVLVAGGSGLQAEIYDPQTGEFTPTGAMTRQRSRHQAVPLHDGDVLIISTHNDADLSAELYDWTTGTFTVTGSPHFPRNNPATIALLPNGKVLLDGAYGRRTSAQSRAPELYDPVTGSFIRDAGTSSSIFGHSATPLPDGRVVMAGGWAGDTPTGNIRITRYLPENIFTGRLTVPEWSNSREVAVEWSGETSGAPLGAGSLSTEGMPWNMPWGEWIPATGGETIMTTWNTGRDGRALPLNLRLRDVKGQVATVVTGAANVDTVPPETWMTPLDTRVPNVRPATFTLSWGGSDDTSGIATYDVEVRRHPESVWSPVVTGTTATSAEFTGSHGETYFFRARATDVAGNVQPWPEVHQAQTRVDARPPTGNVSVAHVGPTSILLLLDARDEDSEVEAMRVGIAGAFQEAPWEPFATTKTISFGGPPPAQLLVHAQFRDTAGNVSMVYCASHGGAACGIQYLPVVAR